MRRAEAGVTLARKLGHPFTFAVRPTVSCPAPFLPARPRSTRELTAEVMTISAKQNFPMLLNQAAIIQGWALAGPGSRRRGPSLKSGRECSSGRPWGRSWSSRISSAYSPRPIRRADRLTEGLDVLTEALSVADRIGEEGFWEAELYRLRGERCSTPALVTFIPRGRVVPESDRRRRRAALKGAGAAVGDKSRSTVQQQGRGRGRGPGRSPDHPRLVHRGLRHAGSERGTYVAGHVDEWGCVEADDLHNDPGARHRPAGVGSPRAAAGRAGRSAVLHSPPRTP